MPAIPAMPLLVIGLLIVAYFIPSFLAAALRREHVAWIIAINVLFGWTAFGWAMLVVWAFLDARRPDENYYEMRIRTGADRWLDA